MELRVTSFYGKATVLWDEGSILCTHAHEILIEVTLAWGWACLELETCLLVGGTDRPHQGARGMGGVRHGSRRSNIKISIFKIFKLAFRDRRAFCD